nr:unnamed protein product [Digitaria exilis]
MAAVLNALAPFVIKMIKDMSDEELTMLLGVSVEIKKLGGKRWVSKLKGTLYEATDILELCHLGAEERRNSKGGRCWESTVMEKAPGCLRPLLFLLRSPGFAHGMGSRINELNQSLDAIRDEMSQFRFEPSYLPERTRPSDATPHSRTTTSLIDESAIVGDRINRDTKALVKELLSSERALMVVSIVGPGGMGKTTLAKKITNDQDVKMKFGSKVIWLSVTENYDEERLLRSAITQATNGGGGGNVPGGGDKQVLSQALVSALTSRFLLVLDDVWSDGAWACVLRDPVMVAARRHPGSRVIITTRNEELVRDMVGAAAYREHHVQPMDDLDAWSLLKKQLPPQDVGSEEGLDNLRHIGIGIIRKCGGLPLAIKAIGGLLRTKRATEHEWNGVLHDPAWNIEKSHRDLNIALQLSYEDLPPALKQCFLYYSLIPKGLNLHRDGIIYMWMSEGFLLAGSDDASPRKEEFDVGVSFYTSLIRRNLIEPLVTVIAEEVSLMHDVIRSFAQFMAKEEALVIRPGQESTQPISPSTKFRRLSIESSESESAVLPDWNSIAEKQELLRSLILSGRMKFEPSASTDSSSTNRLPSLRMLWVRYAESDRFVHESLGKLKHLRFLYLSNTDISRLPDDIYKLKFLEQICIENCASFSGEMPSSIIKLERLRRLVVGPGADFAIPKGFGGLTNLRTLGTFHVQTDGEWCSLQELGSLSQLRDLKIQGLEAVLPSSSAAAAKAKLHDKQQLRTLTLACNLPRQEETTSIGAMVQRVEEVFDQLCPPRHLGILCFENYLGRRGPSWLTAATVGLNSLVHLQIRVLPFCTQLPDGLCQLPSLETMTIGLAPSITHVGPEFVKHQRRRQRMVSFPRLQFLSFKGLPRWEEWAWEAMEDDIVAMPSLQRLFIHYCNNLERLPSGLASSKRVALKELRLDGAASITVLENFPSVEELCVFNCPSLKIIRGFVRLQLAVINCPALEVLEDVPTLDTLVLFDPAMETLPEYLRGLKARQLEVGCHRSLHDLFSLNIDISRLSDYLAEREKVKHCGKVKVWPAASHAATIQGRQAVQVLYICVHLGSPVSN